MVSNHLRSLNIKKSLKECRIKWHSLVKSYRILKLNKKHSGKQIKFNYFVEMDDILGSTKMYAGKNEINETKKVNDVIETNGSSNEAHEKDTREDIFQEEVKENTSDDIKKDEINYEEEYYKRKIEEIDKKKDFREKILKIEEQKLELERAKLRLATEKFLYKKQCRDVSNNIQF